MYPSTQPKYCPATPVRPAPAYPQPTPSYAPQPAPQYLPTPSCLPPRPSGTMVTPASYEYAVPAPSKVSAAGEFGEFLIDAAIELIEGFGELFGSDDGASVS